MEYTNQHGVTYKVGDVVTGYVKGVHRILEIQRRFYTEQDEKSNYGKKGQEYSPIVVLEAILSGQYKPRKGKSECDISYCRHFTADNLRKELTEVTKTYENAIKLLS